MIFYLILGKGEFKLEYALASLFKEIGEFILEFILELLKFVLTIYFGLFLITLIGKILVFSSFC